MYTVSVMSMELKNPKGFGNAGKWINKSGVTHPLVVSSPYRARI
jgi:hypothetical protein